MPLDQEHFDDAYHCDKRDADNDDEIFMTVIAGYVPEEHQKKYSHSQNYKTSFDGLDNFLKMIASLHSIISSGVFLD